MTNSTDSPSADFYVIPAVASYVHTKRDALGESAHSPTTKWLAEAQILDADHRVLDTVITDTAENTKEEALAAVIGRATGSMSGNNTGQTIVLPHERYLYTTQSPCPCPVCRIIESGAGGTQTVLGHSPFPDLARAWEQVRSSVRSRARSLHYPERPVDCGGVEVHVVTSSDRDGRYSLPPNIASSVTIYTDASMNTIMGTAKHSMGQAGIAAVDEHGRYCVRVLGARNFGQRMHPVDYAELHAIDMALKQWMGLARNISIRSDSRNGVDLIAEHVNNAAECNDLSVARAIAAKVTDYESLGGTIDITWIKGHADSAGNDTADQLAKIVRKGRARTAALRAPSAEARVLAQKCQSIVADNLKVCPRPFPVGDVGQQIYSALKDP